MRYLLIFSYIFNYPSPLSGELRTGLGKAILFWCIDVTGLACYIGGVGDCTCKLVICCGILPSLSF